MGGKATTRLTPARLAPLANPQEAGRICVGCARLLLRFRQAWASTPTKPTAAKSKVDGSGVAAAKRNAWTGPPDVTVPNPTM